MVIVPVTEQHPATEIQHTWSLFQQTYLLVFRYFEAVTARFGLSYPQAAVLTVLRQHGRPMPLSHVARMLTQEAQSTTELADRLERRGYVQRIRDPRDRRLVLLELTASGQDVVDQIMPALQEAGADLFGALDSSQLEQLTAMLPLLRHGAADRLGIQHSRFNSTSAAKNAKPSD
jgi:DNA-binding MarR family transcriptional regulator